jgi:TetR/AcrR family transcriptional repressor of nem operon
MARPREFDEEEVLDKAMHLFWTKGYESTSISDLEQHLGLGRQSIYNVFGDKRQVFLKALGAYAETQGETIDRILLHGEAGLDDIRAYLVDSARMVASSKPRRACLVVNTVMENATADPEIAATCRGVHHRLVRGFRAALERAVVRREIAAKSDLDTTAVMLAAQAYGISVLAKSGVSTEELKRTAAAFVDRVT